MHRLWLAFVALVLIVALAQLGLHLFPRRATTSTPVAPVATTTTPLTYTNASWGYSFSYPSTLAVHEYTPEIVSVGTAPGPDAFDSRADVSVDLAEAGETASFADFAARRAQTRCAADGPGESLSCPRVASTTTFTTASGLSGERLLLELADKKFSTGAVSTTTFPVWIFNISANAPQAPLAALIIYQPLASFTREPDASLPEAIAESLQLNKISTR